ncbi:MAG: serpin family protein [Pirellulales bacterium]
MHRLLTPLVAGLLFWPVGVSQVLAAKVPQDTNADKIMPPTAHVAASNHLAFDLYAQLRGDKEGENLFYSPTSISMALAMTSAGARGDTAKQMANVLHWERDAAALHSGMNEWIRRINAIDQSQEYQLRVANRLWAQQGYKFLADFLMVTRQQYQAELGQVDFQTQTEAARQSINRWVVQQTAGKIEDLLPPGSLEQRTKLVLTNAIYFKGNWATPFKKTATRDMDFKLSSSQNSRVPMMQMTEDFRFARLDRIKVLQMPYTGGQLAMVIVLPDDVDGLAKVEEQLSPATWKQWTSALKVANVSVRLPRFKMTSEFKLNESLSELGMPLAFEEGSADFSGMNGKHDLFISAALHKAFVDVNEEGTEAAAATGIVVTPLSAVVPSKPEEFHADHPFLFAIVDNRAGSVLFLGRVLDPK